MNLIFIGMMGAGKSTVGRALAGRLSRPLVDTDQEIVAAAGRSIPAIFDSEGEAGFRRLETETLHKVLTAGAHQVVATGGGAVLSQENRQLMREYGKVIWLDAPPAELLRRAVNDGVTARPLLNTPNPAERLMQLYEARRTAYSEAAHLRIDTAGKSPEVIVSEICAYLEEGC